jgi:hypothetical protein
MSRRSGRAERWRLACRNQCVTPNPVVDGERNSPRMTHSYKLSRRISRLRAPVFAGIIATLIGCNSTDSLTPSTTPADAGDQTATVDPTTAVDQATDPGLVSLSTVSFAGGIPIGLASQPTSYYGNRYNGALRNIWPAYLLKELAGIKARGGKVVLAFAGSYRYYKDGSGHFSLDKWKQRINRFKGVNFSSYVNDGTIVGHYIIDEPNDPSNWGGRPIPPSTVEQMAQYSKSLWPGLVTIARVEPSYLNTAHYLDAAWAQYVARKGAPDDYIRRNVNDAQNRGLSLVIGLNVLKGGYNGSKMTASQVQSWGSTLLNSSYPCAFISWQWNDTYLSSSGIKNAMDVLRNKAENRSNKTCR